MNNDTPPPKTREQAVADLREQHEHVLDLDNLPQQEHYWVDRGLKLSCEGAGHPMHQAWKRPIRRS